MSPFTVVPGRADSSVVIHVPHPSTYLPDDARSSIVLDDEKLATELSHMTDAHTEELGRRAAEASGVEPWLFINGASRLAIDPERFPDEREEMRSVGMGAVYVGTSDLGVLRELDEERDARLVSTYFEPYAAALERLVAERLDATGRAVIVDLHSYPRAPLPYERHQDERRPEICIGVDDEHTPDWLRDTALAAFDDIGEVLANEPFHGTYVPLAHYRRDMRVSSVMVEVRRDHYMTEPGG